jgi:hypothetical protein
MSRKGMTRQGKERNDKTGHGNTRKIKERYVNT